MRKLKVDQTKCIGCGTCVALFPKNFRLNDQGKSEVISNEGENLEEVASSCPVGAISYEEEKTGNI